ncbi:hypothetical protein GE21DRAFT_10259 [Neurospora crassa]|nr:hypothetical protein GE21DRAFT_10259 [Neurospora crassa]
MADLEVTEPVENEQQFWHALNSILSAPCPTPESLDDVLRSWLELVATGRDRYLDDEDDIATCSQQLRLSSIFRQNADYVRTQIIYSLLQEDEYGPLHVISNFLLLDGRAEEETFRRMVNEGCFLRLLELIKSCGAHDGRLHRLLLELMYEMSRIEKLPHQDLAQVEDEFVIYLFQLIEAFSDDVDDPYHYAVIRVLLVMNEQYMVASASGAVDPTAPVTHITNRVVKVLSLHGPSFRTFGENIILLLNRATETSLQLIILKLLYLLFTTKATYEYFYTNDLRVLLDVIIRNLLDLPVEMNTLRHTYLRVLAPLLSHTQLSQPPHYKRDQILSLLEILRGSGSAHFLPPEPTTLRLVERVANIPWLVDDEGVLSSVPMKSLTQAQNGSTVSVIANVHEKPGIETPSRKSNLARELRHEQEDAEDAVRSIIAVGPASDTPEITTSNLSVSSTTEGHKAAGRRKPSPPPARRLRAQKSLPIVPKHRHGVPVSPQPPHTPTRMIENSTFAQGDKHGVAAASSSSPTAASAAEAVSGDGKVSGPVAKKQPPKLPPPRRGKLRAVNSLSTLHPVTESLPQTGSTPVA